MKKTKKAEPLSMLCMLLLCGTLTCALNGCGSNSDRSAPSDLSESDTSSSSTDDTGSVKQSEDTDTSESEEPATDNANTENDTYVSTFTFPIRIEMKSETQESTADDGTVYYTSSYTYPILHVAKVTNGNDKAVEKINADIRSRVDSFLADTEIEEWAKEGYEYSISEENEYPFYGYSSDLTFRAQRSDNNVISFTMTFYSFSGGAHGNYSTQGVNYNTKTGELISFSELSDDINAFHEDTLAYNRALAKTDSYQMRMFSEDMLSGVSLESVLYADDAWYLSPSGLTFISNPYALGPYSSGTIEFVIPYTDLAGMGFNESYTYTDRLARKLLSDTSNSFDLNGDGTEDTFFFSTEVVAAEEDTYRTLLHLTINDVDFSAQCTETLSQLLTGYSWGELSLFDLNVDDDYTELVIFSGAGEGEDYKYYSYFFRYTKDGRLLYLGKTNGDAMDPSVPISALE